MNMRTASALASLCLTAPFAPAAIVGVTGMTTWLGSPPVSCTSGTLLGMNAYTWDEQQGITLSGIACDMVNNPGNSGAPVPGVISGLFDSHFIHYQDFTGVPGPTGTITFNGPIIGVIFRPLNLDNSDVPCGALGTTYPTGYPFRGLATTPVSFVTINSNVLTFDLKTMQPNNYVDQVRVITATPTPGSAALLGLAGLAFVRRRAR